VPSKRWRMKVSSHIFWIYGIIRSVSSYLITRRIYRKISASMVLRVTGWFGKSWSWCGSNMVRRRWSYCEGNVRAINMVQGQSLTHDPLVVLVSSQSVAYLFNHFLCYLPFIWSTEPFLLLCVVVDSCGLAIPTSITLWYRYEVEGCMMARWWCV
jgi:hypothetical protein